MKKILFIAFAVVAFSNLATAQASEKSAAMTPAPTQAEIARDTKIKLASIPQTKAQLKQNNDSYRQAGLNPSQMQIMKQIDMKRADIEKDPQLTTEQRSKNLIALETERQSALKKSLGDAKYQKYLTQNPTPVSATKSVKTKAN